MSPQVWQKEYAGDHAKMSVKKSGPVQGKTGATKWANESKTRGQKATGRSFGNKCESTLKSFTKMKTVHG